MKSCNEKGHPFRLGEKCFVFSCRIALLSGDLYSNHRLCYKFISTVSLVVLSIDCQANIQRFKFTVPGYTMSIVSHRLFCIYQHVG